MQATIVDTTLTKAPTGGAQTFLLDLCRGLISRGWRTTVITQCGPDDSVAKELRSREVCVREDLWKPHHLPEERGALLAEWVNVESPDVYVISISPDAGWLALPQLDPRISTVSIAHNDVGAFYAPLRHYGPFVDCGVGVSQETHRKVVTECGIPQERARHIPYGVKPLTEDQVAARWESRDGDTQLRIGYVGRIAQEQKRVLDFVPIIKGLRDRRVSFELHFVGDGETRGRLETLLRAEGLFDSVRFWGWLPQPEAVRRLSSIDVFVLPSDHEGLPVALLEAMSQGVAPVVTKIASGNTELVRDGVNGYLLPVGDFRGFADRLERLAGNRVLLRQMRRAAWETSLEYTVDRMVERYVTCFDDLSTERLGTRSTSRPLGPYPVMPCCRSRFPRWLRKVKWALAGSGLRSA